MFRPLALWIGLRYTRAERSNRFISFISLISMIGLTLGVAVLITVLSVMNGFDRELKSRILGMVPQATVTSSEIIPDWQGLSSQIQKNPQVEAVAPFIQLQGMLTANGQVAGIMVTGVVPEYEKKVSIIGDHMIAGSLDSLTIASKRPSDEVIVNTNGDNNTNTNDTPTPDDIQQIVDKKIVDKKTAKSSTSTDINLGETQPQAVQEPVNDGFNIIIGKNIAQSMGVTIGDKMTLVLPEASPSPAGVIPRFKRFTVTGIYDISPEVNNIMAFIPMNDAARLLRLPDGAQGMRMKLKDLFIAPQVANQVASINPQMLTPSDWTTTHGNLFGAIQMEKAMVGLLLSLIILVAAFNIVSSLVMLVTDKKADIAILKTFGASPRLITQVFMVQGLVIGVIGTLAGTVLGVIMALSVSNVLGWVNSAFNLHLFDAYFVNYLPSELEWQDVLLIVSASLLVSFLATIYPARRASQIQPAQTLRYE